MDKVVEYNGIASEWNVKNQLSTTTQLLSARCLDYGACTHNIVTGISSDCNLMRVYIERLVLSRLSWVP